MTGWYRIKYTLGTVYGETLVYAHDEKEAEKIAEIQIKASKRSRARFSVVSVGNEGSDSDSLMMELQKFKIKNP